MESSSPEAKTPLAYKLDELAMSPETFAGYANLSRRQARRHYIGAVKKPHISTRRKISDALKDLEQQMRDTQGVPPWLT